VAGIVICLYDAGTKLANEVVANLHEFLERNRGTGQPWSDAVVFDTRIRRNVKLAECPSHGRTIFDYAPGCPGARDYEALAHEILAQGRLSVDVENMNLTPTDERPWVATTDSSHLT
jgi:chromosome partitioning protein